MKNTLNTFVKFKSTNLDETEFVSINDLIISGVPLDSEENEMELDDGLIYDADEVRAEKELEKENREADEYKTAKRCAD